jgi:hypothetical protein
MSDEAIFKKYGGRTPRNAISYYRKMENRKIREAGRLAHGRKK